MNINLELTSHNTSYLRRAYVGGSDVYINKQDNKMYALVGICQGIYQSGRQKGDMCKSPCNAGAYTCSAHSGQDTNFGRPPIDQDSSSSE